MLKLSYTKVLTIGRFTNRPHKYVGARHRRALIRAAARAAPTFLTLWAQHTEPLQVFFAG